MLVVRNVVQLLTTIKAQNQLKHNYIKVYNWTYSLGKENAVILTNIQPRYDVNDPQQENILIINNYIKELAARVDNVYIFHLDEYHGLVCWAKQSERPNPVY